MPDKTYKDFLVDEPTDAGVQPVSKRIQEAGMPLLVSDFRKFLGERGYEPAMVDSLTTPNLPVPGGVNWDTFSKDFGEFMTDPNNVVAVEEMEKLTAQIEAGGVDLNVDDRENLQGALADFGAGRIEDLAEARNWWTKAKQQLANQAADHVSGGAANLTLGMSLLDIFERFDKGVKMMFLPEKTRAQFENEVLPNVTIGQGEDEREFSTGTSAAVWLTAQKLWGLGEMAVGGGTQIAGGLVKRMGNEPLGEDIVETGRTLAESGKKKKEFVAGQIPPLVAGLGRPLPWMEVIERGFGLEEEFDDLYRSWDDQGMIGKRNMMTMALGSATLDVFGSPVNVIGVSIAKLPALGRVLMKGTAKAAEITGKVAKTTHRLDDAIDSVNAAQSHFDTIDTQVTRSVSEAVRVTGRPQVQAQLYRRWILARRHLNNHKQFLEGFREPQADEVFLRTPPRRNPKLLPAPKDTPIAQEMHKARVKVLERGADQPLDWSKSDMPSIQQRQVFGPDDAEVSGDALNMIARSGGLSVDDVSIGPVAPEYYVTPAHGPVPTIPWRNLDMADDVTKAERNFLTSITRGLPEKPGQPVYDLKTSTTRMLVRGEDVIRRNLGTARAIGDKEKIALYTKHLELNRTAQAASKAVKEGSKYDDIWLPPDQPTIMSSPERFNRWLNTAGDRVVRSIYPGALRVGYWHSKAGRLHNPIREPQRFYEVWDPETWNRIRSSRLRHDQSMDAWDDLITKTAETAGIVTKRDKFNPLKHWAPYTIGKEKASPLGTPDELLFDLLNTVEGSKDFERLAVMPEYTPKLIQAHDKIRRALEIAADSQGIKGTDRYLEGYIMHFFDKSQFADGARPLEYMGMPRKVELFAQHLMQRRGNEGYERSAMAALELYGRSMNRKTILEPMYDDIIQRGTALSERLNNRAVQTYVNDYVSTLQGKPTMLGHALDEWIGDAVNSGKKVLWNPGEVDRKLMGVTSALYAGILTGNPRYPFMQIATAIPTTAMRFGLWRTAKGIFGMATPEGQALTKAMGVYKPFMDIFESPAWQRMARLATETVPTVTPFGVMTNAAAERAIRGTTAWAALDMYLTKFGFATWDEAVQAGWGRTISFHCLRASEEVNHMFGAHGRSPFLLRKLGGSQGFTVAATQFLSFTWKQTDELLSAIGRGGAEGLGRIGEYMAVSGWVSHVAAQHLGVDATNYVGLGYFPEAPDEVTSPAVDMMIKMFNHGASYAAQDPERIAKSTRELLDSADNMIPLMGGFETASRGAKRLTSGTLTTAKGEKIRDMDFKGILPDDLSEMTFKDLAGAIRPGTAPEGLGGEAIPTMTGQQNIRERLERHGLRVAAQEERRFYYNARTAVDKYIDAAESGDVEAERRLAEKLENVYKIRLRSDTPIKRAIEARQISKAMRMVDPKLGGDKKMLDRYIKIFKDFGIGLEP